MLSKKRLTVYFVETISSLVDCRNMCMMPIYMNKHDKYTNIFLEKKNITKNNN